jgi:hypothetical protein
MTASAAASLPAPASQHPSHRTNSPLRTHVPALAPWWLTGITVATLLGFQPTLAKGPGGLDLAHAIHGTAALGWSLLLIVQAALAQDGRRAWHRQLAVLGVACAVTMVSSSVPMLQSLAAGALANAGFRPIGNRLWLMDVMLLALFVALFAVAMANVRRATTHARAMAATGILALPAGLGRAYMRLLNLNPAQASYLALATGAAILAAVIVSDRRRGVRDVVLPAVLVACVAVAVFTEFGADAPWLSVLMHRT